MIEIKSILKSIENGNTLHVNLQDRSFILKKIHYQASEINVTKENFTSTFSAIPCLKDITLPESPLDAIAALYQLYRHSLPSEKSDKRIKNYFTALNKKDLEENDFLYGIEREQARAALELYTLLSIHHKTLVWDEDTMGKWFWQHKEIPQLILLREWIDPEYTIYN